MKKLYFVSLLFFCATLGFSQDVESPAKSGNAFLRQCSIVESGPHTEEEIFRANGCVLYIGGFVQGVEIASTTVKVQNKMPTLPEPFCRPDHTESQQLVRIVLKYVRDNPEDAHRDTMFVAMWAFQKAFPCSGK